MLSVDLNCDLGESFGNYTLGLDERAIPLASSVNVACGMHAGDPLVMRRTVKLAVQAGCAVGAHPGYPDLQGFGRRDMGLSPDEVYAFTLYQIGSLAAFCRAEGMRLHHVKPHGQLYNKAAVDESVAQAVASAVADFDRDLTLVGLANGKLVEEGRKQGLRCAEEFFADRNYLSSGSLVPRKRPGAIVSDEEFAVKRVVSALRTGFIESVEGEPVSVNVDTICTHGDNERAIQFLRLLRTKLEAAGIAIKPTGGR